MHWDDNELHPAWQPPTSFTSGILETRIRRILEDFLFLKKYLFIYLSLLGLSCSMQALSCSTRDLGSLTRDRTQAPCIGSVES